MEKATIIGIDLAKRVFPTGKGKPIGQVEARKSN